MKKPKPSFKRRKCKYPHCEQILSIYNQELYCHVHLSQIIYDNKHQPVHA